MGLAEEFGTAIPSSPIGQPGKGSKKPKSTGAEAIVSACGWCERNFMDSIKGNGDKMKVLDIAELVQQAI